MTTLTQDIDKLKAELHERLKECDSITMQAFLENSGGLLKNDAGEPIGLVDSLFTKRTLTPILIRSQLKELEWLEIMLASFQILGYTALEDVCRERLAEIINDWRNEG